MGPPKCVRACLVNAWAYGQALHNHTSVKYLCTKTYERLCQKPFFIIAKSQVPKPGGSRSAAEVKQRQMLLARLLQPRAGGRSSCSGCSGYWDEHRACRCRRCSGGACLLLHGTSRRGHDRCQNCYVGCCCSWCCCGGGSNVSIITSREGKR